MNRQQQDTLRTLAGGSRGIGQPPAGDPATREWTMEHFLDHPALRGAAAADVRFHGNRSAERALGDLARAVRELNHGSTDTSDQSGGTP